MHTYLLLLVFLFYGSPHPLFNIHQKVTNDRLSNPSVKVFYIQSRNSDPQKVEWVNMIISQVWPYLDGFLKLVLQSVEEDANLKSRLAGYHIQSVSFPHGSLGKIPPKLAGIKFHQARTI